MAKTKDNSDSTPARPPPSLKKSSSSTASDKNQRSILGFFSKAATSGPKIATAAASEATGVSVKSNGVTASKPSSIYKKPAFTKAKAQNVTPVPSSDAVEAPSSQEDTSKDISDEVEIGLPSPLTPAKSNSKQVVNGQNAVDFSSPSRKVKPSYRNSMSCTN
jgi:DNA mismatch repair protein MSH6